MRRLKKASTVADDITVTQRNPDQLLQIMNTPGALVDHTVLLPKPTDFQYSKEEEDEDREFLDFDLHDAVQAVMKAWIETGEMDDNALENAVNELVGIIVENYKQPVGDVQEDYICLAGSDEYADIEREIIRLVEKADKYLKPYKNHITALGNIISLRKFDASGKTSYIVKFGINPPQMLKDMVQFDIQRPWNGGTTEDIRDYLTALKMTLPSPEEQQPVLRKRNIAPLVDLPDWVKNQVQGVPFEEYETNKPITSFGFQWTDAEDYPLTMDKICRNRPARDTDVYNHDSNRVGFYYVDDPQYWFSKHMSGHRGQKLYRVWFDIRNPFVIKDSTAAKPVEGFEYNITNSFKATLMSMGYDAIIYVPAKTSRFDEARQACLLFPESQIKNVELIYDHALESRLDKLLVNY